MFILRDTRSPIIVRLKQASPSKLNEVNGIPILEKKTGERIKDREEGGEEKRRRNVVKWMKFIVARVTCVRVLKRIIVFVQCQGNERRFRCARESRVREEQKIVRA